MNRHSVPRTEVLSLGLKENSTENKRTLSCIGPAEKNLEKCSEEIINLTIEKSNLENNEMKEKAKNNKQSLLLTNKNLRKGSLTSECSSSTEIETPKNNRDNRSSASVRFNLIWK